MLEATKIKMICRDGGLQGLSFLPASESHPPGSLMLPQSAWPAAVSLVLPNDTPISYKLQNLSESYESEVFSSLAKCKKSMRLSLVRTMMQSHSSQWGWSRCVAESSRI